MNAKTISAIIILSFSPHCWPADILTFFDDPLKANAKIPAKSQSLPNDQPPHACTNSLLDNPEQRQALTLATVVDIALCNNPQLKSAWAAIKIQAGLVGEAKSAFLPTLNATVGKSHQTTQYADNTFPDSDYKTITRSANFTWHLFDFGVRKENLESANQLLNAAVASHEAAIQKLFTSVTSSYFDLMTAQATLDARAQSVKLATSTLQNARRREARGVVAASDSFQAATALAKAELALSRATSDTLKARSVLLYLMALPLDTAIHLPSKQSDNIEVLVENLSKWLSDANQWHPAIIAAKAKMESSAAKARAVAGESLPTVDLVHTYSQNNYPNQNISSINNTVTTTALNVNFPLFEGFSRHYKYRGALAQHEQDEANFKDTESQVMAEVVKAYSDAQAAVETLQSSQQLLNSAEAALQSSQKRYDKGAADILELISTQSSLAEAQQERIRCLSDWRSARLRLMASTGMLNKADLK